jgi:predicted transcriptional regulator
MISRVGVTPEVEAMDAREKKIKVGLKLPADLDRQVERQAKRERRTKSTVVERALTEYLERQPAAQATG